jgi:hypothetical protein
MRVSVSRASALVALSTVFSVLAAASASAQTVDELVAKHVAARGGADKLKAINTMKITRTVATPFTSVQIVMFKKRPNLLRIEQTPKGQTQTSIRGLNEGGAWDIIQGKVVMRPEALATEARETDGDLDGLLVDWKEKGHTVTFEGKAKVGLNDAYKLKVTTKSGIIREVYLDANTFLESQIVGRVRLPVLDPKTKEHRFYEMTVVFADYRDVNGVKFPFSIDEERVERGITQSFAHYTDKIEVNVPMEDSLFTPPAAPPGAQR